VVRRGVVLLIQDGGAELPLVRQPDIKVAHGPGGQVHQQLRQVELRIDVVPAAGGGEAGENRRRAAPARIAHEQGVFTIQHYTLHLAFRHIVVNRHGAVGTEDGEFEPLAERVVYRLRHGMFGEQLLLPAQQFLPQFGQEWRRLCLASG
jgi:hypothetical protein